MRFGAIVAARTGSQRLPGKALLSFMGIPAISLLLRRIKQSENLSEIILATTDMHEDNLLAETAHAEGVAVFRGSKDDVLGRYVQAAKKKDFDYVVRITGDCPLVDAETLDYVLKNCREIDKFDLATTKPLYPRGIDYEVYPVGIMENIYKTKELTAQDREHVTNYIYRNAGQGYRIVKLSPPEDIRSGEPSFLLDTQADYEFLTGLLAGVSDMNVRVSDLIKRHKKASRVRKWSNNSGAKKQ
jgi:spore coat polysaccharide biosynthesis protein SpsF (cytidylyltransferase family)